MSMDKTKAKEAMKELTMTLIYLSRFTEGRDFFGAEDFRAWRGYDFDVLDELDEEDYIRQGSRRSKSVYITDAGKQWAQELLEKYGIDDWMPE